MGFPAKPPSANRSRSKNPPRRDNQQGPAIHQAPSRPAPISPIFIVRFFHRASNHLSTHRRPWPAGTPPLPIVCSRPRHHQAMTPQPKTIQQLATPSSRHPDGLKPIPAHARSMPHGTTATISTASSVRYDFYKRPQWDRSELGSTQTQIRSISSKASSGRPFCRSNLQTRSSSQQEPHLPSTSNARSAASRLPSDARRPQLQQSTGSKAAVTASSTTQ